MAPLIAGLEARHRAAVAEALNLVDDRRPERRELALELLEAASALPAAARARRVGITGAPGAGKSTLLNALVEALRERAVEIAVIAVDPSSRRSGGALLGDRARLGKGAREQGVFLRSMAARDRLGGLADATQPSVCVLAAAFDWVFVETVGVGQSECEVADLVDTLVLVAQPGAGDTLQFMKAGLLEVPDVFVVNKSDMGPLAERTRDDLVAGLDLGRSTRAGAAAPPVLLASARDRRGVGELLAAIDAHHARALADGTLEARRRAGALAFAVETLVRRYGEYGLERIGGVAAVEQRLGGPGGAASFRHVLELGRDIEAKLGAR